MPREPKRKVLQSLMNKAQEPEIPQDEILDKATDAVIQDLPVNKRKAYERKSWGNRPENLRKPMSQMSEDEKKQLRLWQAGELKSEEKQEEIPAYQESEIFALGSFILPLLCKRLPNPIPPTPEELTGFAQVMTPLANKYAKEMKYKEEINGGLFALAFIIPRLSKSNVFVDADYKG